MSPLGSRPESIIAFQDLHFTSPATYYAAYQVVTLVNHMSWKAIMDAGWDLREGFFNY